MRWAFLTLSLCLTPAAAAAQPLDTTVTPQLSRLHAALQLSPAQEPAWTAYTRAISPNPDVEARHRATDSLLPTLPTPRRIALIAATMQADEADFRHQGVAVNAFYLQLTPSQRRTFDDQTLPSRGSPR
jgi:hypothetical protein